MKLFLGLVLALAYVSAEKNLDDFINEINTKQTLWKAGKNFNGAPLSQLVGLLGSKKIPEDALRSIPLMEHKLSQAEIPKSFDSRTNWPNCKTIKEIRDQSACGSCWAVAVTSVISDRTCIHSNGTINVDISARNLMTCDDESGGCYGGYTDTAFKYWMYNGLVTGGEYGSKTGCQPYPFAPCEHHTQGSKPACPEDLYKTPKCEEQCDDSSLVFKKDRHYGVSVYQLRGVPEIQAEIMKRGPVTANFDVYGDFYLYKSGVYVRTSEELKGRHAVKVIGWGEEKGTKYWLVLNSWNEDWGDKGLFKIRRGSNECGIESEVLGGMPR